MKKIVHRLPAFFFVVLATLGTSTSLALQTAAPRLVAPSRTAKSSPAATGAASQVIPFVITQVEKDEIGEMQTASEMCVNVFFNEDNSSSLLKAMQLAYLRNLQYGELRMKFFTSSEAMSEMFVAREVVPATESPNSRNAKQVGAADRIYNAKFLDTTTDDEFVLGGVLGFVEVCEKKFRLGEKYESSASGTSTNSDVRPFLSNLSVREDARRSGVGSALVDSCETAIRSWPRRYNEIVLQVEDDNTLARKFYEKRGYVALFADPACRRFDTTGWMLRRVPTTKVAMRKMLNGSRSPLSSSSAGQFSLDSFFGNLRQLVGN